MRPLKMMANTYHIWIFLQDNRLGGCTSWPRFMPQMYWNSTQASKKFAQVFYALEKYVREHKIQTPKLKNLAILLQNSDQFWVSTSSSTPNRQDNQHHATPRFPTTPIPNHWSRLWSQSSPTTAPTLLGCRPHLYASHFESIACVYGGAVDLFALHALLLFESFTIYIRLRKQRGTQE